MSYNGIAVQQKYNTKTYELSAFTISGKSTQHKTFLLEIYLMQIYSYDYHFLTKIYYIPQILLKGYIRNIFNTQLNERNYCRNIGT